MVELSLNLWLRPEDVHPEATLVFLNEGVNTEIPARGATPAKKVFEIFVQLPNGEKRLWTMNVTSQRAVAQAYGGNTQKWVGRSVTVFTSTTIVNGQQKQGIFAKIPSMA